MVVTDIADMAARLQTARKLLSEFESSLKSFQASNKKFQVLKTVYPAVQNANVLSAPAIGEPASIRSGARDSPKTLIVLDSSFNPPSIAHEHIALTGLEEAFVAKRANPVRLLLMFAVLNADKGADSPAAFPQRLTMMSLFAQDLLQRLASKMTDHDSDDSDALALSRVPIDIGVAKVPYYNDKSEAIATERSSTSDGTFYPDNPVHIHLLGFDTLTRFFNPKYYSSFDPPLSALDGFFRNGHSLRVTLRPDNSYGSEAEQRAWAKRLEDGELESAGGKKEWAGQVELAEPNKQQGVSSTSVRKAAAAADSDTVRSLCSPGVAAWIEDQKLYTD